MKKHLAAIWAFSSSPDFATELRKINQKLSVDNGYVGKIPFDLEDWQSIAEELYPDCLPEPWSNDPTQWLFSGHPASSTDPLQVAVARLLGYHWPETLRSAQGDSEDGLDPFADNDGIVCLPAVAGEQPAAERLRALLAHAYSHPPDLPDFERYRVGDFVPTTPVEPDGGWSVATQQRLLAALQLKEKLELIRDGEPPYDIFVRWKSLHEQAIGWEPDLNDGVRLNIRPFVTAGVLRRKFSVHWKKDRGKNPDGSERINDPHFARAEKMVARRSYQKV